MVSMALHEPQVGLTSQISMILIVDIKSQNQLIRPHCSFVDLLNSTTYTEIWNISTYQHEVQAFFGLGWG